MIGEQDVTADFGAKSGHVVELALGDGVQDFGAAQRVGEDLDAVEPMLDLIAVHPDQGMVPLPDPGRFLVRMGSQHIVERCGLLPGIPHARIVNHLVFVPNGPAAFLHDEVLDAVVRSWRDPPLPAQLEILKGFGGHNVPASLACNFLQDPILHHPATTRKRRLPETAPSLRGHAVKEQPPTRRVFLGRQDFGARERGVCGGCRGTRRRIGCIGRVRACTEETCRAQAEGEQERDLVRAVAHGGYVGFQGSASQGVPDGLGRRGGKRRLTLATDPGRIRPVAELHVRSIEDLLDPALKPYRTLRRRKDLERQCRFVAEGEKVVRRLLESPFPVESLLITEEWLRRVDDLLRQRSDRLDVFVARREQIEEITGFSCYQGIKAVGRIQRPAALDDLLELPTGSRLFVALDEISNAENIGVIVRNAAALGANGLIVGETSGSPFLTRAIRTSMGAIFRLPAVEVRSLVDALGLVRGAGIRCVAAHPGAERCEVWEADLSGDCCMVLGSEGYGLRGDVLAACDQQVSIPMWRGVDSLNVSSAAAVFLYEAARQRNEISKLANPTRV
jgi:tRNA G18 (ribose-2'-O)-methylase SpoU